MSNKISLRRIKSFLSLRAKRRSNLNLRGFSLIELMVAVVVLALAIFGIFLAYSTGFMGMADARDRTVATNYLQETLEDFKNMNFNKIKDEPITLIPGTKYHRGSIVLDLEKQDEVVTLKKIITQIRWMDRAGNIKTEEASTLIYNKPNTSDIGEEATQLILYAESYYTIMPTNEVNLIAEIQDENGNIFDWDGPINFSVVTAPANEPPVGGIKILQPVIAENGIANCIFTAISAEELLELGGDVEGTERIQAFATIDGKDLIDTVNIRVTTGPVGIILEPATEEDRVRAAGAGVPSDIKLTVVKADYTTRVEYDSPITLSAVGPGTLSSATISLVPTDGAFFQLNPNGTPGIVEITASAPNLDMGYIEITFTGEPASIIVTPEKKSIYPSEETIITVTIVDENIKPVSFGEIGTPKTVTVTDIPDGYSTLDGYTGSIDLSFEDETFQTCIFKASPTGEFPQEIEISANDSGGELNPGSAKINILSPFVAHHIFVTYSPSFIELDIEEGQKFSEINAFMYNEDGNEIVYGKSIKFDTDFGTFSSSGTSSTTLTGGLATAYLYPLDGLLETKITTIQIYSNDLLSNPDKPPGHPDNPVIIEVIFHKQSTPHHINLTAAPQNIFVGGQTCTLTAEVVDELGFIYSGYNGGVKFVITGDTGSVNYDDGDLETFALNGIATLNLTSTDNLGTISITAETLDLIDKVYSSEITINIKAIDIELVNEPNYYDNGKIVMFNINIIGPELNLISMLIEWGYDPSKITKIEIKSPYTAVDYNPIIGIANAKTPYFKDNINTNLLPGESTIRLTFSTNMVGQSLFVTFNTNFGTYVVEVVE